MKSVVFVLLFLSVASYANADVQIGTGTVQARTPFDMYPDLSRCASLYLNSEIGCAMYINALRWQVAVASTRNVNVWIGIKRTSATSLESQTWADLISGATWVYQGNMSFCQTGWVQFSFADFFFDGSDNLAVFTQTDGSPYALPQGPKFSNHASGTRSMIEENYGYFSGFSHYYQSVRPNLQISGSLYTLPLPARNPGPATGYNNSGLSGTLGWDFGSNTATYDLWLGPAGAMTRVVTGAAASGSTGSYAFADLVYQTGYSWQVVSYNSGGVSINGPVWTFRTINAPGVIGNGTASFHSPFGVLNAHERYATIYYPAEIGLTGYLDRISWYCSEPWSMDIGYKIWAKTTTSTYVPHTTWPEFQAGATLLKQGTRNFSTAGWHEFVLDTRYFYPGTENLIIAVETNSGQSGFINAPTFRASLGYVRSILWAGTSNPPPYSGFGSWYPDVALHLQPVGTVAPTLTWPEPASTELPREGFAFAWNANYDAGQTQYFKLYISDSGTASGFFANPHVYTLTGTSFDPGTDPTDPLIYSYGDHKYWTVAACAEGMAEHYLWPPREFTITPWYTHTAFPYHQDFEAWIPENWSATGGNHIWESYQDYAGNNWAKANSWDWQTNGSFYLTSPAIRSADQLFLGFLWSHKYLSGYPNSMSVQISTDQSVWTDLWELSGPAFDANDGAPNHYTPGTGVYAQLAIPISYINTRYWLRFKLTSPSVGPPLFIDDVALFPANRFSAAVRSFNGIPHSQSVGSSYAPSVKVENHSVATCNILVTVQIPGFYNESHWAYQLAAGASQTINFSAWAPSDPGPYYAVAFTTLEGEDFPGDDSKSVSFQVWNTGWETPAYAPYSCHDGSAASYHDASGNEYVITTGGQTPNNNFYVMKYDVRNNSWSILPQMPGGRREHASAVVGGFVYIIGGQGGSPYMSSVYRFNLNGGTAWEQMQSLPVGTVGCKAVAYQNRYIYLAGGYNDSGVFSSVLCYDTQTNIWATATPMPGQAYLGAFAIQGSTLVYVGGFGNSNYSASVFKGEINSTDPLSIVWSTVRSECPFSLDEQGNAQSAEADHPDLGAPGRNYPGGAMMCLEGGTWGSDSVIIVGGTVDLAYLPISPSKAYLFNVYTGAWTPLPNLTEAVGAPYFASVQMDEDAWKAIAVGGINAAGTWITSITQTLTLDTTVTMASPRVSIQPMGPYIRLLWDIVPGAYGGYRVERSATPSGPWTVVSQTPYNTFLDDPSDRSYYRVIALP